MIDKTNIKIQSKLTNKIIYYLNLDYDWWYKREYNTRGNEIYDEDSRGYSYKAEYNDIGKRTYYENNNGYWYKREYDSRGNIIYYETSEGFIRDDRKI